MVLFAEEEQHLAVPGLGGDQRLRLFHLGAGGVHDGCAARLDGLAHGFGDAVGPDDHRGPGRDVGRVVDHAHALDRVLFEHLRVVDDGAEGEDVPGLCAGFLRRVDEGGEFFERQVDPHAESGGLGAKQFHAVSPEAAARASAASMMASSSFQEVQ